MIDNNIKKIIEEKRDKSYAILSQEIGSNYIKYRQKWEEATKGKIFNYPVHLDFEINFGCNFKCEFCFNKLPLKEWNYKVEPRKKISLEKFSEIIKEGLNYNLYSIYLNGNNEPLLEKNLVKYISRAKDEGLTEISLHTNGFCLTKDLSRSLIESGLTIIMFSVDAIKEQTYNQIRHGGNFKELVSKIEDFIKLRNESGRKLPLIRLSFILTKVNYRELPNFIHFWQDNVDFFTIQSFYNPFINKLDYKKTEDKFRLESIFFHYCPESYQRLTIANNGNVSPCCSFFGREITVGNIYENSIYHIWNSDLMKKYRLSINQDFSNQPVACKKCRIARVSCDNISKIVCS